jgi:hypothetical protein
MPHLAEAGTYLLRVCGYAAYSQICMPLSVAWQIHNEGFKDFCVFGARPAWNLLTAEGNRAIHRLYPAQTEE